MGTARPDKRVLAVGSRSALIQINAARQELTLTMKSHQGERGVEFQMTSSAMGYARRAAECVKLANFAKDELIRRDLLSLRQSYLQIAERMGLPMHEAIKVAAEEVDR